MFPNHCSVTTNASRVSIKFAPKKLYSCLTMYVTSFSSISYCSNSEYCPLKYFKVEKQVYNTRCPCWLAECANLLAWKFVLGLSTVVGMNFVPIMKLPRRNHQYGLRLVLTSRLMPSPRYELRSPSTTILVTNDLDRSAMGPALPNSVYTLSKV